eukprot:Nitzschia sp. Nitz4//scaffold497_size4732//407//739//NITZ4_009235-RA/size4732-processed-gene-0.1-mRNA-1//1//CDS//3329553080//811//frame0
MKRLRQEIQQEDQQLAASLKKVDSDDKEKEKEKQLWLQPKITRTIPIMIRNKNKCNVSWDFGGFGCTKGQAVEDNQSTAARGAAAKNKARKYRQYMNRKNGFNRALEKMD